ncbi:hypothetical protein SUDANB176_05606 [Streptomyces sp. enrichment culture]
MKAGGGRTASAARGLAWNTAGVARRRAATTDRHPRSHDARETTASCRSVATVFVEGHDPVNTFDSLSETPLRPEEALASTPSLVNPLLTPTVARDGMRRGREATQSCTRYSKLSKRERDSVGPTGNDCARTARHESPRTTRRTPRPTPTSRCGAAPGPSDPSALPRRTPRLPRPRGGDRDEQAHRPSPASADGPGQCPHLPLRLGPPPRGALDVCSTARRSPRAQPAARATRRPGGGGPPRRAPPGPRRLPRPAHSSPYPLPLLTAAGPVEGPTGRARGGLNRGIGIRQTGSTVRHLGTVHVTRPRKQVGATGRSRQEQKKQQVIGPLRRAPPRHTSDAGSHISPAMTPRSP